MNALMTNGGGYAKKVFKTRAKIQRKNRRDVCRLCRNNLKQKFGNFSKIHILRF